MTSKDEMKRSGVGSPDNLDAAILCTIDSELLGSGRAGEVVVSVEDDLVSHSFYDSEYW
jgi:hypothetical protein